MAEKQGLILLKVRGIAQEVFADYCNRIQRMDDKAVIVEGLAWSLL